MSHDDKHGLPKMIEDAYAKIAKARETVNDLCQRKRTWTMSVPAQPDSDPDLVIMDALAVSALTISALKKASALSHVAATPAAKSCNGEQQTLVPGSAEDYRAKWLEAIDTITTLGRLEIELKARLADARTALVEQAREIATLRASSPSSIATRAQIDAWHDEAMATGSKTAINRLHDVAARALHDLSLAPSATLAPLSRKEIGFIERLKERLRLLNVRLDDTELRDTQEIIKEIHALEWAVARLQRNAR